MEKRATNATANYARAFNDALLSRDVSDFDANLSLGMYRRYFGAKISEKIENEILRRKLKSIRKY